MFHIHNAQKYTLYFLLTLFFCFLFFFGMDRSSMLKLRFDSEEKSKNTNNASSQSSTSSSSETEEEQKKTQPTTKPLSNSEQNSSTATNFPIYQDFMPDDSASNVLVDLESTIEKVLEKLLAAKNNTPSTSATEPVSEVGAKKPAVVKRRRVKRARSESLSSIDSGPLSSFDDSATSGEEEGSNSDDDVNMGGKRNKKRSGPKKEKKSKSQKQKKTKSCSTPSKSSKTLAQVNKALGGIQKKVHKALAKRK